MCSTGAILAAAVRLVALTPSRLIPVSVYLSANVDPIDGGLYDGIFFLFSPRFVNQNVILAGLHGEEFEEDFAVSTLGNSSSLTHAVGDDTGAELVEPPEDDVTMIPETQPEK